MKKIFLVFIFLVRSILANSEWQENNIFYDAWINDYTISATEPNEIALNSGIFRSTNFGNNWFNSTNFIVGDSLVDYYGKYEFFRITKTENFVIVSIKGGSYAISSDKGMTWRLVPAPELGDIKALYTKNNIVYAGSNKGIFISTDEGNSWAKPNTRLQMDSIEINEIKSDNAGNIYFCSVGRVIIYERTTGDWRISELTGNSELTVNSIAFLALNTYLATDRGIFISTDKGLSWAKTNNIFTDNQITSIESVYGYIFVGTAYNGFYKVNDTFKIYGKWSDNEKIGRFVYFPEYPSLLYVLGFGLLTDNDNALFFTGSGYKLGYSKVIKMFYSGKSFVYYTTDGNVFFFRSNNNWNLNTDYLPVRKHTLFYGVDKEDNIYYSDLGYPLFRLPAALYAEKSAWKIWDSSLVNVSDMLFLKDGSLFAMNMEGKLFLSKDNGEKWDKLDLADSISFITEDKTGNFIAVGVNKFYISPDGGNSWQTYINNINNITTGSINTYRATGKTILAASAKGILYSTDYGSSWTLASGVPPININNILVAYNELYASSDSGVIKSLDFGRTWTDFSDGLPRIKKGRVLNVDNEGYIYYSTDFFGLYKSTEHVDNVSSEKENNKNLFGEFPDIISNTITIRYNMGAESKIRLSLVNSLGIEVALLDEGLKESGEQSCEFNISSYGLTSGVYFLRLTGNSETATKKIVIIR